MKSSFNALILLLAVTFLPLVTVRGEDAPPPPPKPGNEIELPAPVPFDTET